MDRWDPRKCGESSSRVVREAKSRRLLDGSRECTEVLYNTTTANSDHTCVQPTIMTSLPEVFSQHSNLAGLPGKYLRAFMSAGLDTALGVWSFNGGITPGTSGAWTELLETLNAVGRKRGVRARAGER
jgi:hypothetical protein